MPVPKLSKLELQIMEVLWNAGSASVRDVQQAFPDKKRPAYTTVQTLLTRLEAKNAVKRAGKQGQAIIFAPAVTRRVAERRLIDDFFSLFGGRMQPVMAHLIEGGRLTLDDVEEAEKTLRALAKKGKQP